MRWRISCFGVMGILLLQELAWATDPVAVLTEIRVDEGEVRVKLADEAEWSTPQPLLSLRPGDQVRVAGDGRAVLVFTGGRGAQIVSPANSPLTIQAPTGETGAERLRVLVARVTQFLLGQQKELTYKPLTFRGMRVQPPFILSPRKTRVLPGPVIFEWAGSDRLRYSIRVFGPAGLLWEETNLERQPLGYPAAAPPLRAGVRYAWELKAKAHSVQRTQFELLAPSEAARIRAALAVLQPAELLDYPRNTVVLMRAGLLFQEGLYHGARRELLAGIAANPNEPTLHVLLGQVYEQTGLEDLAAKEFARAQFLVGR